mmetsp:Transcript_13832/g.20717  ORF Transcript_13832/g.20717 Transcript_13832/m.20717 type:complete len:487 (+) Transcript_13832:12-1472(+)
MNGQQFGLFFVVSAWLGKGEKEIPAAWRAPHVTTSGQYDESWHPTEIKTLQELQVNNEYHRTLLAFINEDDACAIGFSPLTLRHGQRFCPSTFLGIAVAKKSTWLDDLWPGLNDRPHPCAVAIVESKTGSIIKIQAIDFSLPDVDNRIQVQRLVQDSGRIENYGFRNDLDDKTILILWFDTAEEEGIRKQPWREVIKLAPHSETSISSHVSHVFAAVDADTEEFLAKFVCRGPGDWAIINQTSIHLGAQLPSQLIDHNAKAMHQYFHPQLQSRSDQVRIAARELVYDLAFQKRMALSDVQSALVPNVTTDGFRLIPMPKNLFNDVYQWFQKHHTKRNPESDGGPLYNQRYIPTLHTPLPSNLKSRIWDDLEPIMEAWAPHTGKLRGTSVYGIRVYERGSYLHLHDDTAGTHVVSGIINIDQTDCLTDWPVHIFDHQGKLHELPMKPGDMLLYESAKLLHGRTIPCNCSMYANVFVHYAPLDWDIAV